MPNVDETHTSTRPSREERSTHTSDGAPAEDEFLTPGTRVDRHEIVARLGAGGMGVVYKAYDAQLSRHVALKFLHHGSTDLDWLAKADEYRERLLREAQALAQLSHPNVVTVFEVGHHCGSLFLVMEFIEGVSLKAWARERKGRWREVLRALVDAGRGLAAAHRAGVLHRDFKLGNVMVSEDQRVRVLDFGLARAARGVSAEPPPEASGPQLRGSTTLASDLTQSGVLLGTIGYIAPESVFTGTVDERSDQFSYAEAVFVALTGEHSHEVYSTDAYRKGLLERRKPHWPRGISRRVRRVVERGLAFDPSARYATLDAMVDALERAARPARGWLAAAAALPLGAAGVLAWTLWPVSCAVEPHAFAGIWDAAARAEMQHTFEHSGKPYARDSFRLVAEQLDAWRTRWVEMKVDSCRATRVRHEQPERVWSLRDSCLDAKRAQLEVLVSLLRKDSALVDRAIEAAHEAAPLEACNDVARLLGESDRLPEDPARRAAIEKVGSDLDALETRVKAGRWSESVGPAESAAAEADRLGFAPAIARAHGLVATLLSRLGRRDEALVASQRAFRLATEARAEQLLALLSIRRLNDAIDERQFREARALLPFVAANVELARDPALHIRLLTDEAAVLGSQSDYDAARDALSKAQAECAQPGDDIQRTCFVVGQELANFYISQRDLAAALRAQRDVVAAKESYYGPHHPAVALEYSNIADSALMAGDAEGARAASVAARAAGVVSETTEVRLQLIAAGIREIEGDCAGAVEAFGAVQPAVDEVLGADSGEAALVRLKIGRCKQQLGDPGAALGYLKQAAQLRRDASAPDLPEALFALAQTQRALGESDRALASAREALALWREQGRLWAKEAASVEAWLAVQR